MNNKLWIIAVIVVAIGVFAGSYLLFNGAYHTNSNLDWQKAQAHTQGFQDGQTAVVRLAEQCGQTGPAGVIIFIASGTVGTQCYPTK